nr:hypothetical protein [Candidatus Freyarchaeota archaeon]
MSEISESVARPLGMTLIGLLYIALTVLSILEISILLNMFAVLTLEAPHWALLFLLLGLHDSGLLLPLSVLFYAVLIPFQLSESFPFMAAVLGVTSFFNLAIANGVLGMKIYAYTFGLRFTVLYAAINTVLVFFYWAFNLPPETYTASLISVLICIIILYYYPKLTEQESA